MIMKDLPRLGNRGLRRGGGFNRKGVGDGNPGRRTDEADTGAGDVVGDCDHGAERGGAAQIAGVGFEAAGAFGAEIAQRDDCSFDRKQKLKH